MHPNLQIIVSEISRFEDFDEGLDKVVEGCGSVTYVSGAMRVSHLSDFLPWRLFGADVSYWAGRDHPYYASYASQKHLIELAAKYNVQQFVRLVGLSLSFSASNPFNVLFSTMLSCTNRKMPWEMASRPFRNVSSIWSKPNPCSSVSRDGGLQTSRCSDLLYIHGGVWHGSLGLYNEINSSVSGGTKGTRAFLVKRK
jgi:hypothetical protein